jgi:hypothetical protein
VLTVLSGRKEKGRIICFLLFELYLQEWHNLKTPTNWFLCKIAQE